MPNNAVPPDYDESVLPPIAPLPSSDDELENELHRGKLAAEAVAKTADPGTLVEAARAAGEAESAQSAGGGQEDAGPEGALAVDEAAIGALRVSESMRATVRAMEKKGTRSQFRHRIALIGAAELDQKRVRVQQSGAMLLLEAVYQHGAPHWLDPLVAIKPLRDILFKMEAPPVADRGVFYVLTKAARAGISPAAFATHVVLPRMASDYDWRRWKARHVWILDSIVDLLASLRSQPPWDAERLGDTSIITDIALCKYVGRPLARLVSERLTGQEGHLESWRDAWRSFSFKSPAFLHYMRRVVLPCLYRMSGRIDPEQLAPIGRALSVLERSLGRRLNSMSARTQELFTAKADLPDSFDLRVQRRADETQGGGSLVIARELRAYIELANMLSAFDAGPALLGRLSAMSVKLDGELLTDALALTAVLEKREGTAVLRWHFEMLGRTPKNKRSVFIQETKASGGVYPGCPQRRLQLPDPHKPDASALALACGFSEDQLNLFAGEGGGIAVVDSLHSRMLTADPGLAESYRQLVQDVCRGRDRAWDNRRLSEWSSRGPVIEELLLRSLIPGLSGQDRSLCSTSALFLKWGKILEGPFVPARLTVQVPVGLPAGGLIEPAGRDAARARVDLASFEKIWAALSVREPDAECAEAFAGLGRRLTALQRQLDIEHARAITEEQETLGRSVGLSAETGNVPAADLESYSEAGARLQVAGNGRLPEDDPLVQRLRHDVGILDSMFKGLEDVPVNKRDPRRFALAIRAAALYAEPGDAISLAVLEAALARYGETVVFKRLATQVAVELSPLDVATAFMGVEQAALICDGLDALCAAMAADADLAAALLAILHEGGALAACFLREPAGPPLATAVSPAELIYWFRELCGFGSLCLELARWRDLLARLSEQKPPQTSLHALVSRSPLDVLAQFVGSTPGLGLDAGRISLLERPGVLVGRLCDEGAGIIVGSCLFIYGNTDLHNHADAQASGVSKFWQLCALQVSRSVLRQLGSKSYLLVYLAFRALAEAVAKKTKLPVLLPADSASMLLSSDQALASLAENYEKTAGSTLLPESPLLALDGKPVSGPALLLIEPETGSGFRAARELQNLGGLAT
ncbi:MAG: hypothetical protein KKI09_13935 [Spirochaetes bacterium]|nr:hypothetical protein [Spirochaetota bacterium]